MSVTNWLSVSGRGCPDRSAPEGATISRVERSNPNRRIGRRIWDPEHPPGDAAQAVLLPHLLPVLGLLAILRLIMTFNKFDDVYLVNGGKAGTDVAAVQVIDKLNGTFDIGGAAAEALALSAIWPCSAL